MNIHTILFFQKIFLLLFGSFLTFAFTKQLMEQSMLGTDLPEYDIAELEKKLNEKLTLSVYERSLLNCIHFNTGNDTLDTVIGHNDLKNELKSLALYPLQSPDFYKNCDLLKPPNGIILHGPPGTGKTMLAKSLCNEFKGVFIEFNIQQIENKYFGESLKYLNALFSLANKVKPCVIFIDELDGMFGHRNALDQSFVTSIKTTMLRLLDGFVEKQPDVLIIGTTNRIDDIDPAIRRRLRVHFHVGLPTKEERKIMFDSHLEKFKLKTIEFANASNGMSGSDIHQICKLAAHKAFVTSDKNTFSITSKHVLNAINNI